MKTLFAISCFAFLSIGIITAFPQNTAKPVQSSETEGMKKDCVMMKNGKMIMMKGGKTSELSSELTLNNGDVVSPNGMINIKEGGTKMMQNGDCVDMNGAWTKVAKGK